MGKLVLPALNFVVSVVLLGFLFGAIYKVLPTEVFNGMMW
jgi:hypothetical protein